MILYMTLEALWLSLSNDYTYSGNGIKARTYFNHRSKKLK